MDRREESLRVAELEEEVRELRIQNSRLKETVDEYKKKEQSISSAIIASMEHANQVEASRKKLYLLDIQRSRLLYLRMEQIINELYRRYPELKKDTKLREMSEKFKAMVYADLNEVNKENVVLDIKKQTSYDDPIKKLLHNIIDCFDTKQNAGDIKNTKVDYSPKGYKSESGFDINEALHPTMELDEIMREFNLDSEKDKK